MNLSGRNIHKEKSISDPLLLIALWLNKTQIQPAELPVETFQEGWTKVAQICLVLSDSY